MNYLSTACVTLVAHLIMLIRDDLVVQFVRNQLEMAIIFLYVDEKIIFSLTKKRSSYGSRRE